MTGREMRAMRLHLRDCPASVSIEHSCYDPELHERAVREYLGAMTYAAASTPGLTRRVRDLCVRMRVALGTPVHVYHHPSVRLGQLCVAAIVEADSECQPGVVHVSPEQFRVRATTPSVRVTRRAR